MRGRLRQAARRVREELRFYRLVLAHPRTPFLPRLLLGLAVAYLVSPLDIIPDFIPLAGQLDDLIIVPVLVSIALTLVPADVTVECRRNAAVLPLEKKA